LLEVTEAVVGVWGADRVGVRLSPGGTFNSMYDSNPVALFSYVVSTLNRFGLAYLHLVEPRLSGNATLDEVIPELSVNHFRPIFQGTLITAGGYDREQGNAVLASGDADLVAFGRLFISNPDLPLRFALNAPLNQYDRSTFYGGDERGYIDYSALELQTAS
jgi:N-ethylmaleimide reductase